MVGIVLGGWLLWSAVRESERAMGTKLKPFETVQAGHLVGRLVADCERYFDWYSSESVSELAVMDQDGREVRLAVGNVNRRIVRAGYCGEIYGSVSLYQIPGLVRRFYGPDMCGHTEWYVGEMTTDYGCWSAATSIPSALAWLAG